MLRDDTDTPQSEKLHEFHRANIHEHRWAASIARAIPLCLVIGTPSLAVIGVLWCMPLLLVLCAVLNVSMWLWICSVALFGIVGSSAVEEALLASPTLAAASADDKVPAKAGAGAGARAKADSCEAEGQDWVRHVVVLPNYREEEGLLADTLQSLREAFGSEDFCVVLAMEEREGKEAEEKAERLKDKFSSDFARILVTTHPADLREHHLDGSWNFEVPGKASNLKWAVARAYEQCGKDDGFNASCAVLTVADADCLFHPSYFEHISGEFSAMRRAGGQQHKWTMWQAPQLPFRNYYLSPAPSRVWGYISSMYEFGGVSGLTYGGHHMVFSAYSLHLQLAADAQLWDGDVIAEDHHAYIKAFLYSARVAAEEALAATPPGRGGPSCRPQLRVRPVMLPVKSTSVVDVQGYWQSWVARWHQALRHCQGVAELSYILLATWDLVCSLPVSVYSLRFALNLSRVLLRPLFMHIVPICQAMALGVLTVHWLWNRRSVPRCPHRIGLANLDGELLLCGLAGAFELVWPVAVPLGLLALSNFLFIWVTFVKPAAVSRGGPSDAGGGVWHAADGGVPPALGSRGLTTAMLIAVDCAVLMAPIMAIYGVVAELLACWNVMLRGNQFKYITATKATSLAEDYGSTAEAEQKLLPEKTA